MERALWIAASGMNAQQTLTDTIANNIANANTTAYKKSEAQFQDMLYQTVQAPGSSTSQAEIPAGQQLGTGVKTQSVSKVFTQGSLKESGGPLDFAIEGKGFFEVSRPDGSSAYTRAGNFHLDATGQVVNAQGNPIIGFPNIDTSATQVSVAKDGTVSVTVDGATQEAGRIQLVRFANPEGLKSKGNNLYTETQASGSPTRGEPGENGYGTVSQHYLEESNVEVVKEMVDMIAAQRAYEMNSKTIKNCSQMLQMISNMQ